MKKVRGFILVVCLFAAIVSAKAQRNIAEATIVYDMVIQTGNNTPKSGDALTGATTTVYLKGNNSRTDMVSTLGKEITIYNSKMNNAVILKEFSGQKLMITLTKDNWIAKNKMYSNIKLPGNLKR
jgi:hypothetical protein